MGLSAASTTALLRFKSMRMISNNPGTDQLSHNRGAGGFAVDRHRGDLPVPHFDMDFASDAKALLDVHVVAGRTVLVPALLGGLEILRRQSAAAGLAC